MTDARCLQNLSAAQHLPEPCLGYTFVRTLSAAFEPFAELPELDLVNGFWLLHRYPEPRAWPYVNLVEFGAPELGNGQHGGLVECGRRNLNGI